MGAACGCAATQAAEAPVSQPTCSDEAAVTKPQDPPRAHKTEETRLPLAPKNKNIETSSTNSTKTERNKINKTQEESVVAPKKSRGPPKQLRKQPEAATEQSAPKTSDHNVNTDESASKTSDQNVETAVKQPLARPQTVSGTSAAPQSSMTDAAKPSDEPVTSQPSTLPTLPAVNFAAKNAAQAELDAAYKEFRLDPGPAARDKVFVARKKLAEAKTNVVPPVEAQTIKPITRTPSLPPLVLPQAQ